ncbi:transmembrane protein, putative (macronuclear) [Tetrahymena thermophila SB210]|uniref:Transmembrane protein, putative n=1 Tax=Tetrahymena thermophila (strain SB210) TaxID=312017 RepID=W7X2B6_TETTS|nr:transmembrane protein, putative [Tetrahymena thermophila SB210]EWS73350.1 transmembrane protein, putative [Tetrahymena thermophila SB210]|eukprot:XP_012654122.1 transmembrane protein, putative [Tetrahymena thermophila SB210]
MFEQYQYFIKKQIEKFFNLKQKQIEIFYYCLYIINIINIFVSKQVNKQIYYFFYIYKYNILVIQQIVYQKKYFGINPQIWVKFIQIKQFLQNQQKRFYQQQSNLILIAIQYFIILNYINLKLQSHSYKLEELLVQIYSNQSISKDTIKTINLLIYLFVNYLFQECFYNLSIQLKYTNTNNQLFQPDQLTDIFGREADELVETNCIICINIKRNQQICTILSNIYLVKFTLFILVRT